MAIAFGVRAGRNLGFTAHGQHGGVGQVLWPAQFGKHLWCHVDCHSGCVRPRANADGHCAISWVAMASAQMLALIPLALAVASLFVDRPEKGEA
ncbi:MAG: hypothetical protein R2932_34735 [Caldilineaceae bacterium]